MSFFNIPIINIALAIIISWALFAMLCSFAYEAFAQLKAERGRFMKNYILQQLQDFPNGINWGFAAVHTWQHRHAKSGAG
jgi:hypothetical protein